MLANFKRADTLVLLTEGGYVNDPNDPGGPTNLGVTLGTAKALKIDVNGDGKTDVLDIKALKADDAAKVYKHFYWDVLQGDLLPAGVDYAVFDFGVNSGVVRAAQFLQSIVGAKADGHIGALTLVAVAKMDAKAIIEKLSDARLHFLQGLPTWVHYHDGWTKRVQAVRATALSMVK